MAPSDVFINGLGAFFPGEPIGNDEAEAYLGCINGKPSRARQRVQKQNGIQQRHYAIDKSQRTLFRNSEMAARAVVQAAAAAKLELTDLSFLAAATTMGDVLVPGFASMVHGELRAPPMEIATLGGVCASGVMALKSAYLQVAGDARRTAVACASELPSRTFKASRYEATLGGEALSFDTEFLRWMLSDGAGAAVLSNKPRDQGVSLKIEWIELSSHAGSNPVCMVGGANVHGGGELGPSWLDYGSTEAAAREQLLHLKQDIRLLDRVVQLGVDGFFELIDRGLVDPRRLDWLVVHHSSEFFRSRIRELLHKGGVVIPEERWFSNLVTRGNVGAASLFVLLEELVREKKLEEGQQILCMIPESARFIRSYALLTVVGATARPRATPPPPPAPVAPKVSAPQSEQGERLVRGLTRAWVSFEQRLHQVPIVARLESGRFSVSDYRALLVNLRQQVIEGSRWISRAASSITPERFDLRESFMRHARDEQGDYRLLESDYVSVGGALEEIQRAPKNVGSEALSAWMFHRASQPDPFDLLGAMFIIEGLGVQLARRWGELIRDQLSLREEQVRFLLYHGDNDANHFGHLDRALASGVLSAAVVDAILKTAEVTARLYLLQLEEIAT